MIQGLKNLFNALRDLLLNFTWDNFKDFFLSNGLTVFLILFIIFVIIYVTSQIFSTVVK